MTILIQNSHNNKHKLKKINWAENTNFALLSKIYSISKNSVIIWLLLFETKYM